MGQSPWNQRDCYGTPITVAESLRGKGHWDDSPGLPGSRDRSRRAASEAYPLGICELLQVRFILPHLSMWLISLDCLDLDLVIRGLGVVGRPFVLDEQQLLCRDSAC